VAPKLLLAIPAYNEADILERTLAAVRAALERIPGISWRIAVIDNGSTDGTADVVNRLSWPHVSAITIRERGKGRAVRRGAREAEGAEYFGFIDADLSADPRHIGDLLQPLMSGTADIAAGSRLMAGETVNRSWLRSFSSLCFNAMRQFLIYAPVRDSQCGLKLMNRQSRDILLMCRETGWFWDMEFLARAHRKGMRIAEIPVTWNEYFFTDRKSKLRLMRDAVGAMAAMIRIRASL
jgi:dolichyl-phosphate beta-glucosyltransferase